MKKTLSKAIVASVAAAALLSAGSGSAEEAQPQTTVDRESSAPEYGDSKWRYNTYYIFPLTRHVGDSELPSYGQYAVYPLAVALDLAQLPIGLLGGLLGE